MRTIFLTLALLLATSFATPLYAEDAADTARISEEQGGLNSSSKPSVKKDWSARKKTVDADKVSESTPAAVESAKPQPKSAAHTPIKKFPRKSPPKTARPNQPKQSIKKVKIPAIKPVLPVTTPVVTSSVATDNTAIPATPDKIAPPTAQQSSTTPPPPKLLVGGQDLQLDILNDTSLSGIIRIDSEGRIDLPLAGKIPIAGLTLEEAKQNIIMAYAAGFFVKPAVDLKLTGE
jgi:hypothetical protein